MPTRLIPAFLFFCYVNGITPGPANIASLSAAVNYGREAALRQWRGIWTGFAIDSLVAVLVSYFLGNVIGPYVKYLSWIGAAYLCWMAWHTLKSAGIGSGESSERSEGAGEQSDKGDAADEATAAKNCNFMTGLLVNLTNVKVIIFCMTALGSFVLPYTQSFMSLLAVGIFLPFTGPICNLVWIFAGTKLRQLFNQHRKALNIAMAAALVLCAVSLVLQ